jgi:hypothetical protein
MLLAAPHSSIFVLPAIPTGGTNTTASGQVGGTGGGGNVAGPLRRKTNQQNAIKIAHSKKPCDLLPAAAISIFAIV